MQKGLHMSKKSSTFVAEYVVERVGALRRDARVVEEARLESV